MNIINKATVNYSDVLPDSSKTPQTKVSNTVTTEVLSSLVTLVRTSSNLFILEGGTAKQTVAITNGSTAVLKSVIFKDVMSAGASYVAGSVKINGTSYPGYDPAAGFALTDIAAAGVVNVEFSISAPAVLTNPSVVCYSKIDYTVNDPLSGNTNFSSSSNSLSLSIVSIGFTIVKSVNKAFAVSSTRLHYTIVITNVGTTPKSDLMFSDPVPTGSNLVSGSVKINGTAQPSLNPTMGFALADMAAGAVTTIEFETIVS